jgi:hypothetical protein
MPRGYPKRLQDDVDQVNKALESVGRPVMDSGQATVPTIHETSITRATEALQAVTIKDAVEADPEALRVLRRSWDLIERLFSEAADPEMR